MRTTLFGQPGRRWRHGLANQFNLLASFKQELKAPFRQGHGRSANRDGQHRRRTAQSSPVTASYRSPG